MAYPAERPKRDFVQLPSGFAVRRVTDADGVDCLHFIEQKIAIGGYSGPYSVVLVIKEASLAQMMHCLGWQFDPRDGWRAVLEYQSGSE